MALTVTYWTDPLGGTLSNEHVAGTLTGLAAGSGTTIKNRTSEGGRHRLKILVLASGNYPFNIDYLLTPDHGATWYVAQQAAAASIAPDASSTSLFTPAYAAELEVPITLDFRVDIYAPSGNASAVDVTWQLRILE